MDKFVIMMKTDAGEWYLAIRTIFDGIREAKKEVKALRLYNGSRSIVYVTIEWYIANCVPVYATALQSSFADLDARVKRQG